MKTNNIIAGLQTLVPYYKNPEGYHVNAEHDVIYTQATDTPLSEADLLRMIELGWHQEHDERDYEKDFAAKDYRVDESWQAYT